MNRNITTEPCKMSDVMSIFSGLVAYGAEWIDLGKNVSFNAYCVLTASGKDTGITIGDDTLIGPHVTISTADHVHETKRLIRSQGHVKQGVTIGADVWIGAGVIILRGSIVPDGCIIGAGSLVTRHDILQPYGVYVGNPLRQIGKRQ